MIPLWTALTLGFLGSLHCLGMCGPLVTAIPMQSNRAVSTVMNISTYHTSRILAYGFLGLIPGVLGAGLQITMAQQWISVLVGIIFLIACVLSLRNHLSIRIPVFDQISLRIQNLFYNAIRAESRTRLVSLGILNGLIPCGMVYMAMAAALGRPTVMDSMLYMMAFGLGTVPIFVLLAFIQSRKIFDIRPHLQKLIPVSLAILGLIFLWRGLCVDIPMDLSVLKEMGWRVLCH
ncbi:MAG: sulfite exporter TauE/SafE family protein [Saprospiraceae bacterium]|nr:sulfite exporter TauE/SafE family protein [Saprospiraceae bacterium]